MASSAHNIDDGDAGNNPSDVATRQAGTSSQKASGPTIQLPPALSVQQLADTMEASVIEVIKQLMRRGVMANINQVIDYDTAAIIVSDFGLRPQQLQENRSVATKPKVEEGAPPTDKDESSLLKARAPVVTILGHVDHGKTTLLDVIRKTSVTASEKGGITQHIGAYQVEAQGQKITFLDTPGHEAFTAMRARGAQVTDIAVLVVAADDGIMPQTREAIDHAKAADVPIVVAINKIDKAEASTEKVKQQLTDLDMVPEEWGGDTIVVPVSAQTQEGISDLLENILLVAEVAELKANPDREARGTVIEAKLDSARGPVATVLVQAGTLRVGDPFLVGETGGKVRAMFNESGQSIEEAGPSTPVEVLGIGTVPGAGDALVVCQAAKRGERARRRKGAEAVQATGTNNVEQLLAQVRTGDTKELNVILKTDVEGSGEAIRNALERLETDQVRVNVIRTGSGGVTETDVLLATASDAIILAFNTRCEAGARRLAEKEQVSVRFYNVIYDLTKDMEKAVSGLLEPVYREVVEAQAVVKEVFKVKGGKVAGIGVTEGKLGRNALIRVVRDGAVIHESRVKSLRHFKDEVKEVPSGSEGGIGVEGFDNFEAGDVIEAFRREEVESTAR
ncbi:MAG: translation initiation factor IF-2 [Dehalococcoidia bacterium]